jgi:hypothetical protein
MSKPDLLTIDNFIYIPSSSMYKFTTGYGCVKKPHPKETASRLG